MKAVITVLGNDKVGIIYNVTKILAETGVNILDITQTILQGYFSMVMIVDIEKCTVKFEELQNRLNDKGVEMDLQIRVQHKQIFDSMHTL